MAKSKEIIKPYIKHDENASSDSKILKLQHSFKKTAKSMTKDELESFVPVGAYGIFWKVLEYMSGNNARLAVDDVEVLADDLRIDPKFLLMILRDFELFETDETEYISLRLQKDKSKLEEKSASAMDSANTRWLLAEFNKSYKEFFEETPVLKDEEIEALKNYSKKIPDLKTKLRDIIYSLKNLKFDTKTNFKPCANWLLTDNNLARLVNGEFGKLKHKPTPQEIKEQENQAMQKELQRQTEKNQPSELEIETAKITTRDEALDFIKNYYAEHPTKNLILKGRLIINPHIIELSKKFDITNEEIIKLKGVENG